MKTQEQEKNMKLFLIINLTSVKYVVKYKL